MISITPATDVVIIGAGWSGLSAACHLVNRGHTINIFESSKQIGGRARSISLDGFVQPEVDNGQHLLIGAYHETLSLMRLISADINKLLKRQKLELNMFGLLDNGKKDKLHLKTYNLPSPFHLFFGVVLCPNLTITQKLRVIHFSLKLSSNTILNNGDISVAGLLSKYKQPDKLINALWEPLCLATLNTPIHEASAEVFITVLKMSLLGKQQDSEFLFTSKNLNCIFPEPAVNYLHQYNTAINLSSRATEIIIKNNSIEGVIVNNKLIPTKNLILAIPPYACTKLLSRHNELQNITKQLSQIEYQPICTIYLQFPEDISLDQPMIGIWGTTIQWLFDRKIVNQNGLMAAIISTNGNHMSLDNASLIKQVQSELKILFPDWPEPLNSKVIREKRATFSCKVNISNNRPGNKTTVKGLWICGDYTNTNLPATLESAVISGKIVATEINIR